LKNCKHQRQVTEGDHVNVRIHLGAAIFEKATRCLKRSKDRFRIARDRCVSRRRQTCTNFCGILMQHKHRKNISDEHPHQD
jgi:hypothetical protein